MVSSISGSYFNQDFSISLHNLQLLCCGNKCQVRTLHNGIFGRNCARNICFNLHVGSLSLSLSNSILDVHAILFYNYPDPVCYKHIVKFKKRHLFIYTLVKQFVVSKNCYNFVIWCNWEFCNLIILLYHVFVVPLVETWNMLLSWLWDL